MSESYPFTIKDVADKLDVGESTLNVWRNRYREWIPGVSGHEQKLFSPENVELFRFIMECTDAGMDTWEIKDALASMGGQVVNDDVSTEESKEETTRHQEEDRETKESHFKVDSELITPFKGLFSDILNQQTRIADAQERRAAAEERKAYALESRAEAELLKANVMRDMVTALQDMSVNSTVNSLMDKVKNMPGPSMGDLQELGLGLTELKDLPELTDVADVDVSPVETPEEPGADVGSQELAQDTEQVSEESQSQPPVIEPVDVDEDAEVVQAGDMDDLSQLIDATDIKADMDIDDLSKLVAPELLQQEEEDLDDLSALIDDVLVETDSDIDDLSLLLEKSEETVASDVDMDDLSALISEESVAGGMDDMDDLSALIDVSVPEPPIVSGDKKPVEKTPPAEDVAPAEKPPVDPNYKSQILKRIIGMKQKEGLSIEEVVKKFNDDGVKTLSGKGQWDKKTIAGIYKYIDSVQTSS